MWISTNCYSQRLTYLHEIFPSKVDGGIKDGDDNGSNDDDNDDDDNVSASADDDIEIDSTSYGKRGTEFS